MKYLLVISTLTFLLQGCVTSRNEMVQEPNAIGKDVDGIVEGLKARGFSCSADADVSTSTIFCGNERLTLLCQEKVFLYIVVISFEASTRKITSLSRTNCL